MRRAVRPLKRQPRAHPPPVPLIPPYPPPGGLSAFVAVGHSYLRAGQDGALLGAYACSCPPANTSIPGRAPCSGPLSRGRRYLYLIISMPPQPPKGGGKNRGMTADGGARRAQRRLLFLILILYVIVITMPTPAQDLNYTPGSFVFGYSVCGLAIFGVGQKYPSGSVLKPGAFSGKFGTMDVEERIFTMLKGPIDTRTPRQFAIVPLNSIGVSKKWRNRVIFQVNNGHQQIRRYTQYDGSPKIYLIPFQAKYAEAVSLWQTFPPATKITLNARAAKLELHCSGYAHWISLWLTDNPARLQYLP